MAPISDSWLLALSSWGVWLTLIALKSVLLLLLLEGALAVLARSMSASARHTVRLLGLLALLAFPLVSLGLPGWGLPLMPEPALFRATVPEYPADLPVQESARPGETGSGPVGNSGVAVARSDPGRVQPETIRLLTVEPGPVSRSTVRLSRWELAAGLVSFVWVLGTLMLLARLVLGFASVWWVRLRSREVSDPLVRRVAAAASSRLKVRGVRLYSTPRLEVALSVGILRPVVLLPPVVSTWSQGRLRSILLHEFSHARRFDNLSNLVSEVACAVFWPNPLVWRTARSFRIDRERACDDQVLQVGTRASDYAGHLLEVARAVSSRRLWGALEVSQSSVLKDRFQALLNPGLERRALSEAGVLVTLLAALVVVVPVSTLQPWAEWEAPPLQTSLSAGLSQPMTVASRLRRSPLSAESLNPVVNPSLSSFASEARRSVLRGESASEPDRPQRADFRTSSGVRRQTGRPATTVVSTAGVVSRSESARRLQRFRELYAAGRADGTFAPTAGRRGTGAPGFIPGQVQARPVEGAEGPETEDGGSPGSGGALEVAEIATFDLGTLGVESEAADINDYGIVVGQSRTLEGVVHPFLWSKEVGMMDLGEGQPAHTRAVEINASSRVLCETFDSYQFRAFVWSPETGLADVGALDSAFPLTVPQSMNEAGHVVGSSRGSQGVLRAFIWKPESGILEIEAPGWSEALDLNDSDQVVGYSDNRAFLWSDQAGFQYIGPEDALFSAATAVNRLGQVVGWARYEEDQPRAFYWSFETGLIDLGALDPNFPLSMAFEISDLGIVVGHSLSVAGPGLEQEVRAFRWTLQNGMEGLGRAPSNSRIALNALGQIVGTNLEAAGGGGNPLAFLWTEEGRVNLSVTPDPDGLSSEGVAINNNGQIAGNTLISEDLTRAYLWEVRFASRLVQGD